ncbi:MAG TPA: diaminopimelate decarboxylase [Solirubrobacteraceae bacterium]|nr:diaminopimelate decarboxylase [Solirubrobacteraceae bacterium]
MAATTTSRQLSHVWPVHSALDERGVLQVGGCDALELAREFGTPAYVVAEDDVAQRARTFREAFAARHPGRSEVYFASKAFPCTAILRVVRDEGLGCDVASSGELHLALRAGFPPERILLHGNAKSAAELTMALDAGIGLIVLDSLDDLQRTEALARERGVAQRVLLRVTPGVRGDTHDKISTGQSDSKFGLSPADTRRAIDRLAASTALQLDGLHLHIGSQILDLEPFRAAIAMLHGLGDDLPVVNVGGGLGVAYTAEHQVPTVEEYVDAKVGAVEEHLGVGKVILDEPGRALTANAGVTLYTVQTVKRNVSTWVAVDGGMADNLRPMLYGAPYEAEVVGRHGGGAGCRVVGKHCESGDVLVHDAHLADPRPGDVIAMPATGAYGHAMANTYNGVPRPPVILCRDGDARVVVRRETLDDLLARDA